MNHTYDTAMLICGIILFLFGLGLIAFLARAGKSFAGATALIPIAIVMIGFPVIKEVKLSAGGIELNKNVADEYVRNPEQPAAKANFDRELATAETARKKDPAKALAPDTLTALQTVEKTLSGQKNLSPESRVTLARTQLLLGQTTNATANLHTVMVTHPQLITANPNLRMLVRPAPTPANP